MRWRAFFSIIVGAAAWPAAARAQSPGRSFGPRKRGLRLAGRLGLPIVGRIVPFGKPLWWPALGIYFAGCGNLWNYRSLGQNLCWRFEWSACRVPAQLGHLCRAASLRGPFTIGESDRRSDVCQ
jgi:hypothetical protein